MSDARRGHHVNLYLPGDAHSSLYDICSSNTQGKIYASKQLGIIDEFSRFGKILVFVHLVYQRSLYGKW